MNRAQRRSLGHRGKWDGPIDNAERRTDVRHGVCKKCGHRKLLWLPANLCEKDLLAAATSAGLLFNKDAVKNAWGNASNVDAALSELDRMEADA